MAECGPGAGGSGQELRSWFESLDDLDVVRPPIPTGLRAQISFPSGIPTWNATDGDAA